MASKKMNVLDFKKYKNEGKIFTFVTGYDYTMATIINDSDIDIILVGDSLGNVMLGYDSTVGVTMNDMICYGKSVVKGAPNKFIVVDMPFGSYNVSCEQAITNANRIIAETGCDCVKLEGGVDMADKIQAIVKAGIPVMAHIGLTPQSTNQLGGFKVQGKGLEAVKKLLLDGQAVEEAGAFSVVVECVTNDVAKLLTKKLEIPTLGIGAGPHCNCQVLVTQDLLGMYNKFTPKFVKKFANIRDEMIKGLNKFHDESLKGEFPSVEYTFDDKVEDIEKLY